jgi:hypothetical protein
VGLHLSGCSVFVVASEIFSINVWLIRMVHFLGFTSNISYFLCCACGSIVCCSWFARSVTVFLSISLAEVMMVGRLFDIQFGRTFRGFGWEIFLQRARVCEGH